MEENIDLSRHTDHVLIQKLMADDDEKDENCEAAAEVEKLRYPTALNEVDMGADVLMRERTAWIMRSRNTTI